MIVPGIEEKDQWIPWEVSFSLRTIKRKRPNGDTYTGSPNAMLAVVLPDVNGSYDYYLQRSTCCDKGCTIYHNHRIFCIMRDNMFNRKAEDKHICNIHSTIWRGEHSYIRSVRWRDFIKTPKPTSPPPMNDKNTLRITTYISTYYLKSIPDDSEINNLGNLPSVSPDTQG